MYKLFVNYIKGEGYKVSKEYHANDGEHVFEVLKGLTKSEVQVILEKNNLYTPYFKGSEIGILY